MRAYDPLLFGNTFLKDEAERLRASGIINKKQLTFAEQQLPSYHRQRNGFAHLGLFILGCMLYAACSAFIGLITSIDGNSDFSWLFLVNALFGFFALEVIVIPRMRYFSNGIDDAILLLAQLNLIAFFGFLLGNFEHINILFVIAFITGSLCCLRYVDRISALIACFALIALVISICLEEGETLKLLLPFILLGKATALFFICRWLSTKDAENNYYQKCLTMCYCFTGLLFYLSANYLVVCELGDLLSGNSPVLVSNMGFALFFAVFTLLCPLFYIYFGLQKHNRLLLWLGLLCFAFTIFTIRFYFQVMPLEFALVMGGLLLFALCSLAIKKLKGKTSGLTFDPDKFDVGEELLNLQALGLIEQHAVTVSRDQHSADLGSGGGEFGGAGSGEKF